MNTEAKKCIENYINHEYKGGLIGISKLTDSCKKPTWDILLALKVLESQGKIKIIKRYFCPEVHRISNDRLPFCPACSLRYSEVDIATEVYIEPVLS